MLCSLLLNSNSYLMYVRWSVLSLLLLVAHPASAESSVSNIDVAESANQLPQNSSATSMSQVTNVNQLSDVKPTDWAFQALQSLVELMSAIAGYPDNTFRGNRAMSRFEFAAALNQALERMNEIIQTTSKDLVTREDLATIQRLQQEFATELGTIRARVDTLEARAATLEANQFSPTTKLTGQVIMAVNAGQFNGDRIIDPNGREIANANPNATFFYRAVVDFNTSFTGTDLLKIRLETGDGGSDDNAAGVLEPNFGSVVDFSAKPPSQNGDIGLGRLYYTFKPLSDLSVSIGPDIRTTDYVDYNSYANLSFRDFNTLALTNNYILFPVFGPSAGAAIDWKPGQGPFSVRALYAAAEAANPGKTGFIRGVSPFVRLLYLDDNGDRGLFGDTYQTTVELEYAPSNNFALRLQYSGGEVFNHDYYVFGANLELTLAQRLGIFARYGYGSYNDSAFGDIKPQYWMAGVALRDLFREGALAGVAVGQPFIEGAIGNATQTNLEAFYNYPLAQNIQIAPSIQVINNAGNQDSNNTIVTGTLRTVLSF
ncbi:major outer membrane protein [Nostoc sp. NIES-4103]|nr:major outer membrane protein [Nostoc sp. NIES-4103]